MVESRLQTLSKASNPSRFTFVYGVEYHFPDVNGAPCTVETSHDDVLDVKELVDMFKSTYANSVLCVLLMKSGGGEPAGHFIPIMNSGCRVC